MKLNRFFIVLVTVSFCLGLGISSVLAGFGVSPPYVKCNHLPRGSHYEQIIYLVRGEPKEELLAKVKIDVPGIEDWISIEQGLEFELPKGIQQFPMKVIVDVPEEAALGEYKGTININTVPLKRIKEGVTVALGAEVDVDLRVIEGEFSEFNIIRITIGNVEEGSPIKLTLKIENKGNVEAGPTKVHLDVFDKYHQQLLESGEKDISGKVEPFRIEEISVEFPTNLGVGQYWGDFKVYKDEEVAIEDKLVFYIVEKEALPVKEESKGFPGWWMGSSLYLGIGLIILAGLIFLGWRKRKILIARKKKKQ